MSKDRENIPKADMLMGSMRSMGYSFEAAIADIIDNSISATCKHVALLFPKTSEEPLAVGILDDGHGLNEETLFEAMRYGSDSEETRAENDLGRFGLGMKSASMSQCRILTVVSKHKGNLSAFRWDYNYIKEKKAWILQELDDEIKTIPYTDKLINIPADGTLVVWEDFDVIEKASEGQVFAALGDIKEKVINYLSWIFHRYLDSKRLKITVNNHTLKPLDPFLEHHNKTTQKKEVCISLRDSLNIERLVKVKAFVLPHISDLSEDDFKKAGGLQNFRSLQGFYIYRNQRLIAWGGWFGRRLGLGELTKNARIRVDIPNTLDDIWGIDITKRTASIPKIILNQLRKTVQEAMDVATRKQHYRGREEKPDGEITYIWKRMEGRNNSHYYEVNKENILFKYIKDRIPEDYHTYVDMLVDELEQNIPAQQIYIDICNSGVTVVEKEDRLDDIYQNGITLIDVAKGFGRDVNDIIEDIMKTEPFCHKSELKDMFIKYYTKDA